MEPAVRTKKVKPLVRWVHRYPGASFLFSTLLVLLIFFSIPSLVFSVKHFNAQHCGTIASGMGRETSGTEERQIVACFVHAHQRCQSADISLNAHYVDATSIASLSTANGIGGCTITSTIYPRWCSLSGLSIPCDLGWGYLFPGQTDCRDAVAEPDGLHVLWCGTSPDNVLFGWTP
jgi:hypothetical protein